MTLSVHSYMFGFLTIGIGVCMLKHLIKRMKVNYFIGTAINILEMKDLKNTLIYNKLNSLSLFIFFRCQGRILQKIKIIV